MTEPQIFGAILGTLVGLVVGWLISALAIAFFGDEIFRWMDRLVNRVRKACGLKPNIY